MNEQKAIERLEKTKELWEMRLVRNAKDSEVIKEVEILETAIAALELQDKQQWIPVSERLPDRIEYEAGTAGGQYFRRLEIATKTDTIEYHIGYYDGDVWFDKRQRSFKGDVVAWKIHQPYKQEQLHEVDWKDHMMERFGRVN